MLTPTTIITSFIISYMVNNVPTIRELISSNKNINQRITKCYNEAINEWRCDAVRKKYKGKILTHIDTLRTYINGSQENIDEELRSLLSRWVKKMQCDPVCACYITNLKIKELQSCSTQYSKLHYDIIKGIDQLSGKMNEIASTTIHTEEKIDQLIRVISENKKVEQEPYNIDEVLQRYMDESVKNKYIDLYPIPKCSSSKDTLICLRNVLIEECSVFDHIILILCCRGGLDWYSNRYITILMRENAKRIETFANINNYYLSEPAYKALRDHYMSAESLCSAITNFAITLEIGFETRPDELSSVIDITYDANIQVGPKFVEYMMTEFDKAYESISFMSLSSVYRKHYNSQKKLFGMIDRKREVGI